MSGRAARKTKHVVADALRSVGPSPDLVAEVADLRSRAEADGARIDDQTVQIAEARAIVQIQAAQIEKTASTVEEMRRQLDNVARALGGEMPNLRNWAEGLQSVERGLKSLSTTVVALGERLHSQQEQINQLQSRLDGVAGSVSDGMAVEKRLQSIEDRLLGSDFGAAQERRQT